MKNISRTLLIAIITSALALLPLYGSDVLIQFGISTLLLAVLAQGWNIIGGYTGYASFGNSAFYGLGAYGVGISMVQWPLPFRSEEHTSELQSLMCISYDVLCLKTKNSPPQHKHLPSSN